VINFWQNITQLFFIKQKIFRQKLNGCAVKLSFLTWLRKDFMSQGSEVQGSEVQGSEIQRSKVQCFKGLRVRVKMKVGLFICEFREKTHAQKK